ncbi:histone deacetylase family protein [Rhodovastum atsumiense]|uniref:Histone deacetylase family protein n=1 Tax=Rhodovastum atsumiense TaxID=504468 RepID=A0A5M6IP58_9PROT|nr:histone deacetylase family protein [Rhodovastum atsumiense]
MPAFHHPDAVLHRPAAFFKRGQMVPMPELPERADAILAMLRKRGNPLTVAPDAGSAPRAAVHTPELLTYLETVHARWTARPDFSEVVIPNVFQGPGMSGYPTDIMGQAGYHSFDLAAPIGAGTWAAVASSANVAVAAARLVGRGEARSAYALCRPPGHHAGRERVGGFCYLNNAAIAAQEVLSLLPAQGRRPRVAILDVDLHHGNGTQEIFYDRDDVFFASVHVDPAVFYPFLAGYAHERGVGRGLGTNLNLPLPVGSSEDAVLDAIAALIAAIRAYGPEVLVLSLGLDPYEGDPYQGFRVSTPGFARIGRAVAAMDLPTVLVQEGGYAVADLKQNLASFLDGFEAA